MKRKTVNPDQLCLSIGRPLSVLLQEVQKSSRHPRLKEAAQKMLEGLQILEQADQTGISKSMRAKTAIQEILTK